ncbi:MAG: YHS domain-containing protein [Candidatus Binatia bacterium]
MQIDEKSATERSDYRGKTYYFCSSSCKATFDNDPAKYAGTAQESGGHHHGGGGCC